MHPINGLELNEWAKEQYERTIREAQQNLHAQAVAERQAEGRLGWLRKLLRRTEPVTPPTEQSMRSLL